LSNEATITTDFAGIKLSNPVFTASGTCGYGDELCDFVDVNSLGGFITKSITLLPRKGNPSPRIIETNSGMLNAIGLANIGLERFIIEKIPILDQFDTAVFVNVAGETIEDYVSVIERLAEKKAISGFELNISCPNVKQGGIAFGTNPEVIAKITTAAKKASLNKPLMVKLTPTVTDICETARAAVHSGADALSLVNTFTAMVIDIETKRPLLANRTGGLSGPAIKPIAIYLVNRVYNEVGKPNDIPIMGLGGIQNAADAIEFIIAGATTVAVGTATFSNPPCALQIAEGISKYCKKKNVTDIAELVGCLQ
jgi:dihydroorotate dehydrogenase (NAD+) catalytic subunit